MIQSFLPLFLYCGYSNYQPDGLGKAPLGLPLILNLPVLLLYRLFITTTGGKDASDKYHKCGFSVFGFRFWVLGGVDKRDFSLAKLVNSVAQAFSLWGVNRP
jgi:hypothetical protein